MPKRAVFFVLLMSLAGCTSLLELLEPPGSGLGNDQIDVQWPQDWKTFLPWEVAQATANEGLERIATRDGFGLQMIRLTHRPIGSDFTHTKKKLSPDMLPHQVADIVVDDIKANTAIVDPTIIETRPDTLAGSKGFRINVDYKEKAGLRRQSVVYGCMDKGLLILLSFDAPVRHYFSLDLQTFEMVKDTASWTS